MTPKQFEQRFRQITSRALPIFTAFNVPVRSGRLKESFKYDTRPDGFEITTNLFYMPYTNEQWVSPRWNGRENPNLYWFNKSHEYMAQYIARHLGGRYVRTK